VDKVILLDDLYESISRPIQEPAAEWSVEPKLAGISQQKVELIVKLGFSEEVARTALITCKDDVEKAI